MIAVLGTWCLDLGRGLLGMVAELDRIGSRGGARFSRGLRVGPRAGDGSVEAAKSNFVWMGCKVQILPPQPINITLYQRSSRLMSEAAFLCSKLLPRFMKVRYSFQETATLSLPHLDSG